jgi:Mrp family chromosome partitioning ATPase/capsular polysaccharide biosynthesis protein
MEPNTTTQPRIADYVRPLISRWWLILVAVVGATAGVYLYFSHKPNVYTTSTLIYVQDPGDPISGAPAPAETDRTVGDQASLLYSRGNASIVARQIGYRGTPDELLGQVSITTKQGEDFVQIQAQNGSPQVAAAIANTFARQFVNSVDGAFTARIAAAVQVTKNQLAEAPAGPAGEASRADLVGQLDRLKLAVKVPMKVAQQVGPALAPGAPSSPSPKRDALFAFLLSLVGAIALCYGIERFDRRLKNPEEMEGAYAAPLLAVLPHTSEPAPARNGGAALGDDFREPFRVLRTNLELASVDHPPRTIVVSSAMPGEGKSTVVRNLALAYRETGRRVAVVDLDLRHPALASLFAVPPMGAGLTDVLRHEATLEEALMPVRTGLSMLEDFAAPGGVDHVVHNGTNGHTNGAAPPSDALSLLLGGARPANPPAVLASERVIEVLNQLRDRYDVVLIDSAPVLAVTDTVPLLRYADAALFVGRLGVTTRDTARRLMEFLQRVPELNLLGVVANDLTRLDAEGYGYGYGYGAYADKTRRDWRRRKPIPERAKQTV